MQGHIVDHCYKLHSYPLGHRLYKANSKNDFSSSITSVPASSHTFSSLNAKQCQRLLTMLQNDLSFVKVNSASASTNAFNIAIVAKSWLIDSSASAYIRCLRKCFNSLLLVSGYSVTLPNL